MAEDYVKYLRLVRESLVDDRRRQIRDAVDDPKQANKDAKPRIVDLRSIQDQISAIDAAIDDEKEIEGRRAAAADNTDASEANAFGYDDA
jgi:hypothetical protein